MQKPGFRYDVQALRGLAVLLVMLFHANTSWSPGGFLGVDIFFTISGFVIFRLIDHELRATGAFRFSGFYARRVVRLFPALFATVALTVLFSLVLLPADQLRDILDSALAAALSVANVYFYLDSGYFAAQAIEKPLLHLWSLGVEEQFYLAFPLLVLGIAALSTRFKIAALMVVTVLGAMLSQHYVNTNPDAAFYLPFQRVFQFTAGAVVALLPPPRIGARAGFALWLAVAAGLVVVCIALVSEATALPGWNALAIAGAVAALLYLGEAFAHGASGLQHPVIQFIGNASYSLYLAHWPVAVMVQYHFGERSPVLVSIAVFALGFVLGALLYVCVEKPFRKRSLRQVLVYPFGVCLLILALGYFFEHTSHKGAGTINASAPAIVEPIRALAPVVVMGDSHANSLTPALQSILAGQHRFELGNLVGCPPLTDVFKIYTRKRGQHRIERCAALQQSRLQLIESVNPGLVILAARWELYFTNQAPGYPQPWQDWLVTDLQHEPAYSRQKNLELLQRGLANTLRAMPGTTVAIIGQTPLHESVTFRCAKRLVESGHSDSAEINTTCNASQSALARQNYQSLNTLFLNLQQRFNNVIYIDPVELLCNSQRCDLVRQGELLYKDNNHVSEMGGLIYFEALSARLALRARP